MVSPDENPAILRKAGTMQTESTEQLPALSEDPAKVCGGIFICLGIYLLGTILGKLPGTKVIAGLAWAIIIAVVIKCTGIMEDKITNYTVNGMNFMLKGLLPAIIAGIGINSISIETMISYSGHYCSGCIRLLHWRDHLRTPLWPVGLRSWYYSRTLLLQHWWFR